MYEKYAAKQREIVVKLLEEELNYTDFNSGRELKINMGAKKPQTNADRIRAMSDEELAELLEEMTYDSIEHRAEHWLRWLKQPAEGE